MWRNIMTYIFFDLKRYPSDRSIQAIFGRLHAKSPGRLHSKYSHVIVIVFVKYCTIWVTFHSKI